MAILNPGHLFEQAEWLITRRAGRPRQVDIRRSISAAYYALFHASIAAAVDQFVGVKDRDRSHYGLVYRSVDHKWLRELCKEVQKPTLSNKFRPYEPPHGFGANIVAFAVAAVELQEKRLAADYDVMIYMNQSDATLVIKTARAALRRFNGASKARRVAFLSLLLFPPRPSPPHLVSASRTSCDNACRWRFRPASVPGGKRFGHCRTIAMVWSNWSGCSLAAIC